MGALLSGVLLFGTLNRMSEEWRPDLYFDFSLPDEIWKMPPGWEGLYAISNLGRLASIRSGIVMKLVAAGRKQGYLCTYISRPGYKRRVFVHHLVLEAFVGPVK